jgi:hypothetical protein
MNLERLDKLVADVRVLVWMEAFNLALTVVIFVMVVLLGYPK